MQGTKVTASRVAPSTAPPIATATGGQKLLRESMRHEGSEASCLETLTQGVEDRTGQGPRLQEGLHGVDAFAISMPGGGQLRQMSATMRLLLTLVTLAAAVGAGYLAMKLVGQAIVG